LWIAICDLWRRLTRVAHRAQRQGYTYEIIHKEAEIANAANEDIQLWMWLPGLAMVILLSCIVTRFQYDMPVRETLLALSLAFVLSLIAIQATGATGMILSLRNIYVSLTLE
jgi:hypothetical protein